MSEKIIEQKYESFIQYTNENNELHNINDDPAIIWTNGNKLWFKNGKRHRTKGPAVIHSSREERWYYENNDITDKVNLLMKDGKIDPEWENWTEEDEFLFVLLIS